MQSDIRDPLILSCPDCGHLWAERVQLPMALRAFAKRLKGCSVCPHCGGKRVNLLYGDRYQEARKGLGL